jgi:uncharacterized protein (DUF433 family)
MSLAIQSLHVPLTVDDTGTVRVGGLRLTLGTVIHRFNAGDPPEVIAQSFPPVELADVYAVISYYLRHRAEIDGYLLQGDQEASRQRELMEDKTLATRIRQRARAWRAARNPQDGAHEDGEPAR